MTHLKDKSNPGMKDILIFREIQSNDVPRICHNYAYNEERNINDFIKLRSPNQTLTL